MNTPNTLSIFPFWGGKSRMSDLICEMLDYKHTTIYLELFGGGCRTILNKPRHAVEIYNDSSAGLVALIECLSDPDTAILVMKMLYKTECNEDTFNWAIDYRNKFEDCHYDESVRRLKVYIRFLNKKYGFDELPTLLDMVKHVRAIEYSDLKKILGQVSLTRREVELLHRYVENYNFIMEKFIPIFNDAYKEIGIQLVTEALDNLCGEREKCDALDDKEYIALLDRAIQTLSDDKIVNPLKYVNNTILNEVKKRAIIKASDSVVNTRNGLRDDLKLAAATFIIYVMSRNGDGMTWSNKLVGNHKAYLRYVDNLYNVMKRLRGVAVSQVDAMEYLRDFSIDPAKPAYINMPEVMMYLDPSYLKQVIKSVDFEKSELTNREKILALIRERKPENVGEIYKQSWDYDRHVEFLKVIRDAKCRILLSNYDDETEIYKRILVDENSDKTKWRRVEFQTKTTAGNAKSMDKDRTEVLWFNYNSGK